MSKKEMNELEDKIVNSNIFLVLGTSNYLKGLKYRNSPPYFQSMIAKKHKKPVFIVFLKGKIKEEEKIEIERFFSEFIVVKEIEVDLNSDKGTNELSNALKEIVERS